MSFSLQSLLALALQNADKIPQLINMFKATTAPTPVTTTPPEGKGAQVVKKPDEAIRELQQMLNKLASFIGLKEPLEEDGWLGDKTDAAIRLALKAAKPYLSFIGG